MRRMLPEGLVWWRCRPHSRLQGAGSLAAGLLLSGTIVDCRPKVDFGNVVAMVGWDIGVIITSSCLENTSPRSLNGLISLAGFVCAGVINAST